MSTSRLFQVARNVGVATGVSAIAYVGTIADQKRHEKFQKEHPSAVVRADFQYVPLVGGFWKFSVDDKAPSLKDSPPTYNRA